jgi:6-phosphogluconolactonase
MKRVVIWIAICVALSTVAQAQASSAVGEDVEYMYVGTWTNLPSSGPHPEYSKGIYGWRLSPSTGKFTSLGLVAKADGPESLAVSPNGRYLYATQHDGCSCLPGVPYPGTPDAGIAAYAIDPKTGDLKFLSSVDARGSAPTHIQVDGTSSVLALANYYGGGANYHGGEVVTFKILADGRLSDAISIDKHSGGSSTDQGAMGGPHAHGVAFSPDSRFLYVADKGVSRIYSYRLDANTGAVVPLDPPYFQVEAGRNPRHIAVHPNGKWVYENNEHSGSETFFESADGKLKEIQDIPMMPQGFSGRVNSAESKISPDGRFLYANSREQQGISVFAIDQNNGTLSLVEFAATNQESNAPEGGTTQPNVQRVATTSRSPQESEVRGARMFAWDETTQWVASANLGEGAIVILRRDQSSGKLTHTGQILDVPQPTSVVFVKPEQGEKQ